MMGCGIDEIENVMEERGNAGYHNLFKGLFFKESKIYLFPVPQNDGNYV